MATKITKIDHPAKRGDLVVIRRATNNSVANPTECHEIARVIKARRDGKATHFALGYRHNREGYKRFPDFAHKASTSNDEKALRVLQVWVIPSPYIEAALKLAGHEYETLEKLQADFIATAKGEGL